MLSVLPPPLVPIPSTPLPLVLLLIHLHIRHQYVLLSRFTGVGGGATVASALKGTTLCALSALVQEDDDAQHGAQCQHRQHDHCDGWCGLWQSCREERLLRGSQKASVPSSTCRRGWGWWGSSQTCVSGPLEGIHKSHQVQLLDLHRTPQESHPVPKSADQTFLEPWQSWDRPLPWGACFPCGGSEQDITGMRLAQLVEHDANNTKIVDLTAVSFT